ncbi:MAG TPA: GatB/YqeY domain-containing protein, partial [Candidatus Paceibacterota bacterium]|nr:GatB/YqeY domain-containing protein [Candidatus Paceibacterota bacterium]
MLHQTIKDEIKNAMRAKEALKLEVLRGIQTAFVNELVTLRRTPQDMLEDDKALTVLKRLAKQRKDSMEQFTNGGRPELAEKEAAELVVI